VTALPGVASRDTPGPTPDKGWLERLLSPIADVRPGEAGSALLMSLTMFLVLGGYYLLKTAREIFILSEGGAEVKSYSAAGQALLLRASRSSLGGLLWAPCAFPDRPPRAHAVQGLPIATHSQTGFVPLGSDDEMLARMRPTWRATLRKGLRTPSLTVRREEPRTFVPAILSRVQDLAANRADGLARTLRRRPSVSNGAGGASSSCRWRWYPTSARSAPWRCACYGQPFTKMNRMRSRPLPCLS
jgi:hypothetical protein